MSRNTVSKRRSLSVESLEARTLLAAKVTATLADGLLRITGTDAADRILVRQQNGRLDVEANGKAVRSVTASRVGQVVVDAGGGNDYVSLQEPGREVSRPAMLVGGDGNDTLYGGAAADRLVGQLGDDHLAGGGGADALYGGTGTDRLTGGEGADRFLLGAGDEAVDAAAADARLHFRDGDIAWADRDVLAVDVTLARLQRRTGGTTILKLANGGDVTFERHKTLEGGALGDNDNHGRIRLSDAAFERGVGRTVVHEVGHNWDEAGENRLADRFASLSGWASSYRPKLVQGGDAGWWYRANASFARGYGRTNPREDFATALEVALGARSEAPIGAKLTLLNHWLNHVDRFAVRGATTEATEPDAAFTMRRSIKSVIALRNRTGVTQTVYLMWPGQGWERIMLRPGQWCLRGAMGGNRKAALAYDRSAAAGFQRGTTMLLSKFFVESPDENWRPRHMLDGMVTDLQASGWAYRTWTYTGLETSRYQSLRNMVMSLQAFPYLGGRFEVLGPNTGSPMGNYQGIYNCISWSLGMVNKWTDPVTSGTMNKLATMDQIYARQGYHRLSRMDYSLAPGWQKVVVYAKLRAADSQITEVTHAALQMADGSWTSKLGGSALIRHWSPQVLNGALYGEPVAVYARRV